jgi:hypothetical protein
VNLTINPVGLGKDNLVEVKWSGNRMIDRIKAISDGKVLKETIFGASGSTIGTIRINLGQVYNATIEAIDIYGYKYSESVIGSPNTNTGSISESKTPPTIAMINPKSSSLNLYEEDTFNLRFQTSISTVVREISVTIDDTIIQSATTGDIFVFPVGTTGLAQGKHTVKITVTDANLQSVSKSFVLNILPR